MPTCSEEMHSDTEIKEELGDSRQGEDGTNEIESACIHWLL